jgi:hypothetical protein
MSVSMRDEFEGNSTRSLFAGVSKLDATGDDNGCTTPRKNCGRCRRRGVRLVMGSCNWNAITGIYFRSWLLSSLRGQNYRR